VLSEILEMLVIFGNDGKYALGAAWLPWLAGIVGRADQLGDRLVLFDDEHLFAGPQLIYQLRQVCLGFLN
jgi:hypothetical protein